MPALKPKPFAAGEKLVKIDELPEWMRPAFAGMKSLNRIQSRVRFLGLYFLLCSQPIPATSMVMSLRDRDRDMVCFSKS